MDEVDIVVEFLLEDIELVLSKTSYSIVSEVSPVVISLYEDLKIIKSCLKRMKESPSNFKILQSFFLRQIRDVVLKILDATDSYINNALANSNGISGADIAISFQHSSELSFRATQVSLYRRLIPKVHNSINASMSNREVSSRLKSSSPVLGEEVVGFDDEATAVLDRLTGEQKQLELEVISLVGMAGIGKTTFAKRLYNDSRVLHHFHVRAWTRGPQLNEEMNALHDLLTCVTNDNDSLHKMYPHEMGEKLHKLLKGKRYLIVVDGIWDSLSWKLFFMKYFPDDSNGSKVLITSRTKDVVLKISPNSSPQVLQFLSQEESWELFESKVFIDESCPQELMELGKEMVAKCRGLPLAIVVLAGVAKQEKSPEWWMHIVTDIASPTRGKEQFMDILAFGYHHLPNWLKPCFLYLGSFPQGYEILVKKIVWSWIAEGFVKQNGEKKLEELAEEYLTDLVDRNLIAVSKRKSNGGIKTCQVHDLLRDLCVKKAKDNLLLQPICGHKQISLFSPSRPTLYDHCYKGVREIEAKLPYVSSRPQNIKCFHSYDFHYVPPNDVKFTHIDISLQQKNSFVYKLLRVLDLGYIILDHFPVNILELVHLNYLALRIYNLRKLPPLSKLWNLETLILVTEKGQIVTLPEDIWQMVKLRHLHYSGELEFESASLSSSTPFVLYNLQTISQVRPSSSIQEVLARMPNLVNLGCHLTLSDAMKHAQFPDLSRLRMLETLTFDYQTLNMAKFFLPQPSKFPPNLKKLTLVGSFVDWKEMSILGMLPNLEVLKIKDNFFNAPRWEVMDEAFSHLKFLKLSNTDLQQWGASSSSFPCLQQLVLDGCPNLQEIPSSFRSIDTLEAIELYYSSQSVADSARQIQDSQRYMGNDGLKVLIHPQFEEQ
ncbi:putative late blight resistance protein homolog R1A-3 [Coffea arabica]|uniref:Late blight resistance protein homolog R1A-3 n=1 Tax=Coffea arabica TaxID=13443 RepID=A0A6P6V948_COFAR|nr:putative late blight resistance protein homolog R1B-17 [Coffea arabica]